MLCALISSETENIRIKVHGIISRHHHVITENKHELCITNDHMTDLVLKCWDLALFKFYKET